MNLDLGSGNKPLKGFLGVDSVPGITDYTVDLWREGRPWPFEDDSVDALYSSHFIEHIDLAYVPVWEKIRRITSDNVNTVVPDIYTATAGYIWQRTNRRRDALFHFFSEAYRIAKPGAKFMVVWPNVAHRMTYRDPTHRRFIDAGVIQYLGKETRAILDVEQYDVACDWRGSSGDLATNEKASKEDDLALQERAAREWNVTEESFMELVAFK